MAMHMLVRVFLVALPGFLFNFQPSEPFLTVYLKENKNMTSSILNTQVWPADTYASLAFIIPCGLAAETVGYLNVLLVGMAFREATRVILIFGQSLSWMIIMQVTYAAGHSTVLIYYTLPYILLPKELFAIATVVQHVAYHGGNMMGSILAQALVSTGAVTNLTTLFYISWGATSLGLVSLLALFYLPKLNAPPESVYSMARRIGLRSTFVRIRNEFRNPQVAIWSVCFIFGGATWQILSNYYQEDLLEFGMRKEDSGFLELGIEAAFVIASFPAMFSKKEGARSWLLVLLGASLMGGSFVVVGLLPPVSWYVPLSLNLIGMMIYQAMLCYATAVISQKIEGGYALILTVNTFCGLALATIVQEVGAAAGATATSTYFFICGVMSFIPCLYAIVSCLSPLCEEKTADVSEVQETVSLLIPGEEMTSVDMLAETE